MDDDGDLGARHGLPLALRGSRAEDLKSLVSLSGHQRTHCSRTGKYLGRKIWAVRLVFEVKIGDLAGCPSKAAQLSDRQRPFGQMLARRLQ